MRRPFRNTNWTPTNINRLHPGSKVMDRICLFAVIFDHCAGERLFPVQFVTEG